jgi:hypothetical protein
VLNDLAHLPPELRWTGFPAGTGRPRTTRPADRRRTRPCRSPAPHRLLCSALPGDAAATHAGEHDADQYERQVGELEPPAAAREQELDSGSQRHQRSRGTR